MKTKKKLIFFMPLIGGGGVEKNLFLIANDICNKIDELSICTLSIDKIKKFNKKIKFISPKKNHTKLNIRIQYILGLYLLLKFLLKNKNYVVLSFQANIYCILLCKLLNIKIIVRSNSSPSGWYHNFLKKIIYKKVISLADAIIVNSLEFKNQMENRFQIKVNCIFNPLNKREIIQKSKLKNKYNELFKVKKNTLKIINLGRFTEQKDQMTLLKAIKILKDEIKLKVFILGRGEKENDLKKFITDNNLENTVKIMDFIDNPYPLINQSDFFILTSKYEGLPNVLLEAAVLKKFIISTKCPTGPKEILLNGKGGMFFKIGDHNDLAKKITFCFKNKNKLKNKIYLTYKNLDKYDYNKNINQYYLLLKSFGV